MGGKQSKSQRQSDPPMTLSVCGADEPVYLNTEQRRSITPKDEDDSNVDISSDVQGTEYCKLCQRRFLRLQLQEKENGKRKKTTYLKLAADNKMLQKKICKLEQKLQQNRTVNEVKRIGKESTTHGGEHEFSGAGSTNQDQIFASRHAEKPPQRVQGTTGYPTLGTIPGSIPPIADKVTIGEPQGKQSYEQHDAQKDLLFAATKTKRSRQTQNQDEINRLRQENESLQLRLSRIASDHLTDNNPAIADLSDVNRATKLVEQFEEIYCNQWKVAFDSLTDRFKKTDRESIALLFKILQTINTVCKSRARDQLRTLQTNVANFIGTDALPHSVKVTLKTLKDTKKKCYTFTLTAIQEEIHSDLIKKIHVSVLEDPSVTKYVLSVTKVCWLMNISDPPLVIYAKCKPGALLDKTYFMEYLSPGHTVDFLVWPALRLSKDGSILRKGIAELKNQDVQ